MFSFVRRLDAAWFEIGEYPGRVFVLGVVGGILVGGLFVLGLRPPRCHDLWAYAVPGQSGECPSGSFLAERAPSPLGALVVCRCASWATDGGAR